MPINLVNFDDVLADRLATDPEFRTYWERTALARAVSIAVIRYRAEHNLSQRQLAKGLGMAYAQIARLELGEHNPTLDTLQHLARGLGQQFILTVTPPDHRDRLKLPAGAEVLTDTVLADGTRVLAAVS